MGALASSVPLAILAAASQVTQTIRLGSGGVMLPNHSALNVAEGFRLLGALAPGRVDLGLGRAPGTDGRTARALRGAGAMMEEPFERQLSDLIAYGTGDYPAGHPFAGTIAAPAGEGLFPPLWILSSSGYGARVAAQAGAGLAFAWHINPDTHLARQAADVYRAEFEPSDTMPAPRVIVAASVVTAPTAEEAEEQSLPLGLMFLPAPDARRERALPHGRGGEGIPVHAPGARGGRWDAPPGDHRRSGHGGGATAGPGARHGRRRADSDRERARSGIAPPGAGPDHGRGAGGRGERGYDTARRDAGGHRQPLTR